MASNQTPGIILFLFFFSSFLYAQQITGVVIDGKTKKPIENASVYFDNTTVGVVTNSKGEFSIFKPKISSPLVVSFMGYQTVKFREVKTNGIMNINLFELVNSLEEITLAVKDDWSRAQRLEEFKKQFLGESENGKSCEILNEDDLILTYDKYKKQLTAKARAPIVIRNNSLKYEIIVDLDHFEANYFFVSENKKILDLNFVYYSSANFFNSLESTPTKSTLDKRENTYKGSMLHFLRALSRKELSKQGYKLFFGERPVSPDSYIDITPIPDSDDVLVELKVKLFILYKNYKQSSIESSVEQFYIDQFGNHTPADQVRFNGDLGNQRMGDALPLDYLIPNNQIKY